MPTTELSVVDILKRARALIEEPEHWCQGSTALDFELHPVLPTGPTACRWCLYGALCNVGGGTYPNAVADLLTRTTRTKYWATQFNDKVGHLAVLAALDRAIALASEGAA